MLKIITPLAVLVLSACAPLSQQSTPQSLFIGDAIGPAGGFRSNVKIEASGDVCNKEAHKEGFVAAYYKTWNMFVGAKEKSFLQSSFGKPKESPEVFNRSLYQGKQFNLSGRNYDNSPYAAYDANASDFKRCSTFSYTRGRNDGTLSAMNDYKALERQEKK